MSDEQLIHAVATLWVENGGDSEGMVWCWVRIIEAIKAIEAEHGIKGEA